MKSHVLFRRAPFIICCTIVCMPFIWNPTISLSWPKNNDAHINSRLTLTVKNKPLDSVLQEISKSTGQAVTVNKDAETLPVTITLSNAPLMDALKRIAAFVAHEGYAITVDKGVISLVIIHSKGSEPASTKNGAGLPERLTTPVDNTAGDFFPPDIPGKGLVAIEEVKAMLAAQQEIDPYTVEVSPPDGANQHRVTLGEVKAMLEAQQEVPVDPYAVEVIPPDGAAEHRVTLGEVQAMLAAQQESKSKTVEVMTSKK